MLTKIIKRNFSTIVISLLLFGVIYFISTKVSQENIQSLVLQVGIFGPILLIFLIWLTNIIAPLGAGPFLFAGFYLYGPNSVWLNYCSAIIAVATNFLIARHWGRKTVIKLAGGEVLEKIEDFKKHVNLKNLAIIRFMLYQQHDVISYACGLLAFDFKKYFLVSLISMLPGNILIYWLSFRFENAAVFIAAWTVLSYCLLLGYLFFRKLLQKLI